MRFIDRLHVLLDIYLGLGPILRWLLALTIGILLAVGLVYLAPFVSQARNIVLQGINSVFN